MEKKSNLLDLKYQHLIWRIVGAIREQAQTIPAFRKSHNGCIRITVVPLSPLAEKWFGDGLSCNFGEYPDPIIGDICEREFVFKIEQNLSFGFLNLTYLHYLM